MKKDLNNIKDALTSIQKDLDAFRLELKRKYKDNNQTIGIGLKQNKMLSEQSKKDFIQTTINEDPNVNSNYNKTQELLSSDKFSKLSKNQKILFENQQRAKLIKEIRNSNLLKEKIRSVSSISNNTNYYSELMNLQVDDNEELIEIDSNENRYINNIETKDNGGLNMDSNKKDMVITKEYLDSLKNQGKKIGENFIIVSEEEGSEYIKNTDEDTWIHFDDEPKTETTKPESKPTIEKINFLDLLTKK